MTWSLKIRGIEITPLPNSNVRSDFPPRIDDTSSSIFHYPGPLFWEAVDSGRIHAWGALEVRYMK